MLESNASSGDGVISEVAREVETFVAWPNGDEVAGVVLPKLNAVVDVLPNKDGAEVLS